MTYIDSLDVGCPTCGATYTTRDTVPHSCPPQVSRPTPIHPSVFNVADLDAWLAKRIEQEVPAVHDSETIAHIGIESHKSAEARYGTLITVRELIEAWLAEERDAQPDAAEAWDRLRAEGYTELELRRAAGDR